MRDFSGYEGAPNARLELQRESPNWWTVINAEAKGKLEQQHASECRAVPLGIRFSMFSLPV